MAASWRSAEAIAWRRLYFTKAWKALRVAQLVAEPFCKYCETIGKLEAATVCDHKIPHKGDRDLFFDPENLQSLCAPCHDSGKAREEGRGFSVASDADGYPLDSNHPINKNIKDGEQTSLLR